MVEHQEYEHSGFIKVVEHDPDPEKVLLLTSELEQVGEEWPSYARHKISFLEVQAGNKILPSQNPDIAEFVGGLVDFLRKQSDLVDDYQVIDKSMRVFDAAQQHNQSALITELAIALADRDSLEAADKLTEFDGPIAEEYQDQVKLAVAEGYARQGDKVKALDYMESAYCLGKGINNNNRSAFDRVFNALLLSGLGVDKDGDIPIPE